MSETQIKDKSSILSLDTPLDRLIHKPPARIIARWLSGFPAAPNQVTLFSILPAVTAGLLFTWGSTGAALTATVFFYLWAVTDHVDGELARLTGQCSPFGQKLDEFCDNVGSVVILCGIFVGAVLMAKEYSRPLLYSLFVGGIILNWTSGMLVLNAKRRARENAVRDQNVTERFVTEQKTLDHLTGRDPFYFLILFYILSCTQKGVWPLVLAGLLIGGCYALAAGSVFAWYAMRRGQA